MCTQFVPLDDLLHITSLRCHLLSYSSSSSSYFLYLLKISKELRRECSYFLRLWSHPLPSYHDHHHSLFLFKKTLPMDLSVVRDHCSEERCEVKGPYNVHFCWMMLHFLCELFKKLNWECFAYDELTIRFFIRYSKSSHNHLNTTEDSGTQ